MAEEKKSWDMDTEIMRAINEIRSKDRKRPYCSTITTKLGKKKFTCTPSEVDDALRRLVQRKRIENRGEDGEDSYFVLDISEWPELPTKENNNAKTNDKIAVEAIKYTPLSEFLALKQQVESLRKAVEDKNGVARNIISMESHGVARNIISRSRDLELKEEIALLKKENESLRNEIRRKDLIIESLQTVDTNPNNECGKHDSFLPLPEPNFRLVKKRHATNESPKPTWEPFICDRNRFSPIAPSESDEEEMQFGIHNTTKNQSVLCTGNFQDRRRKEESTEETFDATARPWKQAGGLPQDRKVVKEWSSKTNNGSVRRKTFELRPAAASNIANNIQRNTIPVEGKTTRKTVEIVGDSMVKDIQAYKMNEATGNSQEKIFVKSFSGATVDCMNSHVCPTIKRDPGRIILHCGTNDLRSKATPKEIAEEITDLGNSMKTNENKVIISGLVPRGDQWHNKAMEVNKFLKQLCVSQDFYFIDNTNIQAEYHLNRSRIHLNREGTRILANNFLYALGY